MFTPIKSFNDCFAEQLEYLHTIAQKYVPSYDINRETGEYEECETMAVQQFIKRYNQGGIRRMDKVADYMEDKDIQDYLQALNVDSERFWYLLLFIYDYSFGQCIDNMNVESTPKEELETIISTISGMISPKYIGKEIIDVEMIEPLVLHIGKGDKICKKDIPLSGIVASFIADACSEHLKVCGELPLLKMGKLNMNEQDNIGFTKLAYHFCYMFKYFFDKDIKVERKENAVFSNNEKGLFCHLLYLTEICTNKNILNYRLDDYSTLKGFIKPKTTPKFNAMNHYYYG